MSVGIRIHIARILCLFMTILLLNFSIDAPNNSLASEEAVIGSAGEVENLLTLMLDICMDIEESIPDTTEAETEAAQVLTLYHAASFLSLHSVRPFLCESQLLLPSPNLKTLYPEVSCPPPKA